MSPVNQPVSHTSITTKAYVALALVCFFWGTTYLASKEAVRHMPALQMAGIRQLLGGSLYLIYFMSKGRILPRGAEWKTVLFLSFLNFFLSNTLSSWGLKYISAGLGSIISAIFPLWLVIIGYTRSEKIPARSILGIILGFGGVCVIFSEHLLDFLNPDFSFGILVSLAGTISWALGTTYTKEHSSSFNPYFSLGLQMLISGSSLLIVSKSTGNFLSFPEIPWQSWLSLAYLVVFGSVISFIAYLYALQHLPIEQASIYAYINPIVAVLLGAFFFDEKLSLLIVAGGVVTLWGVYLVNQDFMKKSANGKKENADS